MSMHVLGIVRRSAMSTHTRRFNDAVSKGSFGAIAGI
jgi:hypothetical protein